MRAAQANISAIWRPPGGNSAGFTTAALVRETMEVRDGKRLPDLQRQLSRLGLLIIVELGFIPLFPAGAEFSIEVSSQRCWRGFIKVPVNLPFDEWMLQGQQQDYNSCGQVRYT